MKARGAGAASGSRNERRARKRAGVRASRLRGALIGVGSALVLVLTMAVLGLHCYANRPGPALGTRVVVTWPAGLSAGDAADLLAGLGLVESPTVMAVYLRSVGAPDCFVPGTHLLPGQATPKLLASLLCREAERPMAIIVVPEGFHRFAIASRLEGAGVCSGAAFLRATEDPELLHALGIELGTEPGAQSAEGYLFPATYRLAVDTRAEDVVRRMVTEADKRWRAVSGRHEAALADLRASLGFERREIVTLASMVEKEAAVADERPIIASVFLNRLRDRLAFPSGRLESDPTAMYGCWAVPEIVPACKDFDGKASGAINRDAKNPFTTYLRPGLPPGPIANPGEAAVEAVLAPSTTRYFFFVASGQNRHTFSETFEEHQQAVKRLRERRGH